MTTQKPPSSRIISCHSTITERLLDTYRPRSQGLIIPNSSNVRIRNITRPEKRHRNQSRTTRFFFSSFLSFPFLLMGIIFREKKRNLKVSPVSGGGDRQTDIRQKWRDDGPNGRLLSKPFTRGGKQTENQHQLVVRWTDTVHIQIFWGEGRTTPSPLVYPFAPL